MDSKESGRQQNKRKRKKNGHPKRRSSARITRLTGGVGVDGSKLK
jgi:hypothetical protein